MTTKYILHGGNAQHVNSENDTFFREILKLTGLKDIKVLLVHFASDPEKLEINKERDTAQFERNHGENKINLLEADKENFIQQVSQSDVIYLGGGTTLNLMSALTKYPNLIEAFKDKVVAGESAGANVQAVCCYSKSGGGVIKGLGLLPLFIFAHYEKGAEKEIDLTRIPDNLERVFLGNYQFRVIGA